MLIENGMEIKTSTLVALFAIVDPAKPLKLTLDEFIKFSFDEAANSSNFILKFSWYLEFRKIVKKIRQSTKEETVDNKGVFLPYNFTTLLNFLN